MSKEETIWDIQNQYKVEQAAYWRGYADAQAEILAAMRSHPNTYIEYIRRGCKPAKTPSYEEAISKLKAKYVIAEGYSGLPLTDKLRHEIDLAVLNYAKEVILP